MLSMLVYVGAIGAVAMVMPLVLKTDSSFPSETVTSIGSTVADVVEMIFMGLLAYKINKEGLSKPSHILLATYAVLTALAIIVDFGSEDMGLILSIVNIILSVVVGFVCLSAPQTKKIGLWLLLSMVGVILLMVFADPDNTNKNMARLYAALYVIPFAYYLEKCKTFLSGDEEQNTEESSAN
ncbi:MAG: hypothetical protein J1F43_06620 [Muribaculaceae bacterium]|nr:hypothetical protein [Muribaculaceae bacterium]